MRYLKLYLFVFGLILSGSVLGQGFVTPLSSLSGDVILTTTDMKTIEGKIRTAVTGMKGLTSLTIMDYNGTKHRLKAAQIQNFRVDIDGFAKLEMIDHKTRNLRRMFESDFSEITDRKYAYYEQVKVPGKDRYVLTMLLNPGFDRKIKVYDKPGARTGETSIGNVAVAGGEAKTYYVQKQGRTYEITRSKFKRSQFKELFSDCPQLLQFFKYPDFDDFSQHVLYYQMHCR